ncbi:ABC transporter permease subunit [Micromonospora sp. NPDC050200]|uniref:ABC transporter permease subunit n=1 Tax=Micromonospora sp. NPDC050200 TaxID=3155664 RepID=UPI003407F2B8
MRAVAVLAAELTKIRTVRSTGWTLTSGFVVCVGLAALVGLSFRNGPSDPQRYFDPLFATFYSLTLGQLALVAFAVLVVSGEYRSGTIRASLAAVPRRGLFYGGKLVAGALVVSVVSLVTVVVTFVVAQPALGPRKTSLGADGVPQAMVGAWLYLTLICLFAMGVAAMLRSSALSLGILIPLLLLNSQGLGNIPKVKTVAQFLPDQAGWVIMHLAGPPDDPRWARAYGPWTGLGIVALWAVAALVGGYLVLRRRDA